MKIQLFLTMFFSSSEILFASDRFGRGSEMIFTWSFLAIFSFLGLLFVIYGLFSNSPQNEKSKLVGTPSSQNSERIQNQDEPSKREVFGKKEEELFLDFSEKIESYKFFESITLYYFQEEVLVPAYIKKRGIFIVPSESRRLENEKQVIEKLMNKEGVFNIDHSSLFLPLADETKLYGTIEFSLESHRPEIKISKIWNDTKKFSKNFLKLHSYSFSQKDITTGLYNSEYFWDVIRMKSEDMTFENLTLIRFFNCSDVFLVGSILKSNLIKLFGEDFKIFRLYDSTFSFFLNEMENPKFHSIISEILSNLRRYDSEVHFSVGVADKNLNYRSFQRWFQKAETALEESISSGENQYKQFSLK